MTKEEMEARAREIVLSSHINTVQMTHPYASMMEVADVFLVEKITQALMEAAGPRAEVSGPKIEDVWALLFSSDGSQSTAMVIGDKSKARDRLIEGLWFGKKEEALKDPMVAAIIENFDDPDSWANDSLLWSESLEQGSLIVIKIRDAAFNHAALSQPPSPVDAPSVSDEEISKMSAKEYPIEFGDSGEIVGLMRTARQGFVVGAVKMRDKLAQSQGRKEKK